MVRLVVCVAICSGCVPYVLPPVRGQVGVIATGAAGSRAGVHADVGVAPLQLVRDQLDRRWDVTVAGSFDHTDRTAWGASIAAGPVVQQSQSEDVVRRVLIEAVGRWTTDGLGGGARATFEWSKFVDGDSTDQYGFGEAAFGVYVETGAASVPDGTAWMISVGISLRTPVLAGLACCLK
jgi:hypothetical protein